MDNLLFNQVYKDYSSMVYNLCLSYLQNVEEAEETTQDVFIKVYENYEQFKEESSIKTWIYRIAINKNLDALKARNRVKRFGFFSSLLGDKETSTALINFNHPGVELEDKEALENLFIKINSLPTNQKTALILKSIDGLSQQEVAAIMKLSEKAVESLLSRARSGLKQKLNN